MLYRLIPSLALLALVLTACGEASACPPRPDSPGTFPSGPVSIETDHTVYAPTESPQVSILNLTPDPSLTTPRQGYGDVCPPVALQRLVGEQWQEVNDCVHVGGGDNVQPDRGIPIARGQSPVRPPVPLTSPGTHRFVFVLWPAESQGPLPVSSADDRLFRGPACLHLLYLLVRARPLARSITPATSRRRSCRSGSRAPRPPHMRAGSARVRRRRSPAPAASSAAGGSSSASHPPRGSDALAG